MAQELVVPQAFSAPAKAFASLPAVNLADGIGQSYGIVGYRGKVWSLRYRGERKNIVRPDDGTPSNYLDVIILGQAEGKSKSYFKKFDPNSEGDGPLCSSIDGVVPDPDVPAKQSETCALCPRNVWKTDPQTGRKGRECTDYKRLAVLILPTQTKPILGQSLMEPVFLRVPPASLNSLAILSETMTGKGFPHPAAYITRISFDANEAHPKMIFTPLQPLTDQEGPIILELVNDPTVKRITSGDVVLPLLPVDQQTGITASASTAAPSQGPLQSEKADTGFTALESAQPVSTIIVDPPSSQSPPVSSSITAMSKAKDDRIDTGFGGASTALTPQTPLPAKISEADTGPAEASDADLDARIAGLIKTS
jgi:hypothetical protein